MSATVNVPTPGAWGSRRLFPLLTEYTDPAGDKWLYATATTDLLANAAVSVNPSGVAAAVTAALANAGNRIGAVQVAVDGTPVAAFGWVKVAGAVTVKLGNGCLPAVPLFTSGSAGILDDTSTTTQARLYGIRALGTAGSAGHAIACIVQDNIHT